MTLTLRAVSLNDLPLTQPITAQFGPQGGTIGRADSNTMALPDPERHISRQQAEIRATPGGYLIFNTGSANPITVAGQPLAQGQSVPLRDRDEIRVGGYLLEVSESAAEDTAVSQAPLAQPTAASASTVLPPAPARPASASSDPFGDLLGSGSGSRSTSGGSAGNPFADLLGTPPPPPSRSAFGQTHRTAPVPPAAPPVALLPDDFDPFAPPPAPAVLAPAARAGQDFGGLGSPLPAPPPVSRPHQELSGGGAFADLIPASGNAPSSLDDMFGLKPGGNSAGDPLAGFMAEATKGLRDSGDDGLSTDPMSLFGAPAPKPSHSEPVTPALPDHTSALNSAFRPPEVRPPAHRPEPTAAARAPAVTPVAPTLAPTAPTLAPTLAPPIPTASADVGAQDRFAPAVPHDAATPMFMDSEAGGLISPPPAPRPARPNPGAAAPRAAGASADTAALWQAFSEGAGIRFEPTQGLTPELMCNIGQLLRSSVDGTLQMMAVRAATKHELRAQVTVIRSRDNNPLKFSPDAQSALEQLLQPPVRGFLPGPAAMSDAMHDLVGHTIGTMAGTRAALEGVLGRFKPEMLESKLTSRSMLDSVLTLNRKAKLWELYLQHFEAIREEAQEDFHNLFGKAFLEAYEEQLERLNQRKTAA
ncbi:type VI secretion system-associated FHA domain protein TagH [Roseateles sp. SL47]|uniref:type VI secretion system-associated FHA domain protein TagH n=1 Tax=Roseateles sp. SL47 TaxID=2995138 RepID=UPI00226DD734|nr:type VI secretion system-associated FHA domain protein TagH [Roseateles sp. SL47]WAC71420.1 type VI secretion system-associated FHA domain protein TagH [Roseateles sp. SL47]